MVIRYMTVDAVGGYPVVHSVRPAGWFTRIQMWFENKFNPKPYLNPIYTDAVFKTVGLPIALQDYYQVIGDGTVCADTTNTKWEDQAAVALVPPPTFHDIEELPATI